MLKENPKVCLEKPKIKALDAKDEGVGRSQNPFYQDEAQPNPINNIINNGFEMASQIPIIEYTSGTCSW